MSALEGKRVLGRLLLAAGFLLSLATQGMTQTVRGSSNVEEYDPALARRSDYYRELGPGRADRAQRQQEEEIRVLVKSGQKIYCNYSNQLLHNDVKFEEVLVEQAAQYYDDGTHNDEIPFDGLPSNVAVNNYQYISPYAIAIKEHMERLKAKGLLLEDSDDPDMARWLEEQRLERIQIHLKNKDIETDESKPALWNDMDLWDPLRFYCGLHVVSLDEKTTLPKFVDKLTDITSFLKVFDEDTIGQFRGYEYYPDEENPSWEQRLWAVTEPEDKAVRKHWGLDRKPLVEQGSGAYPGMPWAGEMTGRARGVPPGAF